MGAGGASAYIAGGARGGGGPPGAWPAARARTPHEAPAGLLDAQATQPQRRAAAAPPAEPHQPPRCGDAFTYLYMNRIRPKEVHTN